MRPKHSSIAALGFVCVAMIGAVGSVSAQMPDSTPSQGMPATPGTPDPMTSYPNSGSGGMSGPTSAGVSMKQMFAGTVAAVLGGIAGPIGAAVVGGLSGAIANWFKPKPAAPVAAGQANGAASMNAPGQTGGAMPNAGTTDPTGGMGSAAMGGMAQPPGGTSSMPANGAPTSQIYAGVAFEVHSLDRSGTTTPVDPAVHSFATGERFVVLYRPTLPGTVAVSNINPLGQEKQIDSVSVAAGQLTRLGPYEFRDTTGSEKLRLVLTPCRSDQLVAATRDIVRADLPADPGNAVGGSAAPALGLTDCGAVGTRGLVRTRDIGKVTTENGTQFALDPVSSDEMTSGKIAPRELTLTFTHQ